MSIMLFPRLALAALAALSLAACSHTYTVTATDADTAFFGRLGETVKQNRFWVPAEARFRGTLMTDDPVPAQSSAFFANTYFLPVFPVVREALTRAVAASFAEPYRPDRSRVNLHLNARSDALQVEFSLPRVLSSHGGGEGDMTLKLYAMCVVRYPAPDHRELARIPVQVEVTTPMAETGIGCGGQPGPVWRAAAELARRYAIELQSPAVRDYFKPREAFMERVHSTTGEPAPKEIQDAKYDPEGKYGEYVDVVRLIPR